MLLNVQREPSRVYGVVLRARVHTRSHAHTRKRAIAVIAMRSLSDAKARWLVPIPRSRCLQRSMAAWPPWVAAGRPWVCARSILTTLPFVQVPLVRMDTLACPWGTRKSDGLGTGSRGCGRDILTWKGTAMLCHVRFSPGGHLPRHALFLPQDVQRDLLRRRRGLRDDAYMTVHTSRSRLKSRLVADPGTPGTLRVWCRIYVSAE